MNKEDLIYVAGHTGLAGSAICRRLRHVGFTNLLTRTSAELDLTDADAVNAFFQQHRPTHVFLAAAKVGGILANDRFPADFIRINLQIQTHVIDAAFRHSAEKLLFLGSSCIYPKRAPQPMREDYLLTGPLEPTNSAYAVAKLAGIEMCHAYRRQHGFNAICLMPTNLYGPGDNFDPVTAHALPALIRRFHEAKRSMAPRVTVWGTGAPRREVLHADDFADAAVHLMQHYDAPDIINVGVGEDISIVALAELIRDVVGFGGAIEFDTSKPDGMPRKWLDIARLNATGWRATIQIGRAHV